MNIFLFGFICFTTVINLKDLDGECVISGIILCAYLKYLTSYCSITHLRLGVRAVAFCYRSRASGGETMAETVVSKGLDTTDGDLDTSDAYESIREIDTSKKEVRFNSEL